MEKNIKNKLTIVILNYNTGDLLKNCLSSLENVINEANFDVVVVDNASSDDSMIKIEHKKWKFNIELVKNDDNKGFAGGNNVALRKISSEYTLILNPDTIVNKGVLKKTLAYIREHDDVAGVTCRVELPNGNLDYSCHRGFPTPWNSFCYFSGLSKIFPKVKFFSGYTMSWTNFDTIHEIDSLTGAFALIRTSMGYSVDWFDEDYYWNGEDIDFCYKLKNRGWKIVYIPDVKIIHYKGSSSGLRKTGLNNASHETKLRSALSSTSVMKLFYKKHLEQKYPAVVNMCVYVAIYILQKVRAYRV